MTSLAFILGVVPLARAIGAGAEMRRPLGIAVFSGMLGVTLFGILLTPVFYYVVVRLVGSKAATPPADQASGDSLVDGAASGKRSATVAAPVAAPTH
jgi:multidrug efflux pump